MPALAYGFFYSTGFFVDQTPKWEQYLFTGIGAVVCGIAASFVWIGVGIYIHKIAHHFGKEHLKGEYFGTFNMKSAIVSLSRPQALDLLYFSF